MADLLRLSIDVTGAFRAFGRLDRLGPEAVARVRKRAVVTLSRRIAVQGARMLSEEVTLKRSDIRNRIKAVSGELNAGRTQFVDVIGSNVRLNLALYAGKWGGTKTPGATAQVFKDTPRRTYKSAFINRKSGNILERAFKGGGAPAEGKKRYGRLPIRQLRGPSIGSLLISPGIGSRIISEGRRIVVDEVNRLIDVELRK